MKLVSGRQIYSVSEVNYFAKQTLEQLEVWVEGEIISCKKNPNYNFYYIDLKDNKAVLPCIVDGSMLKDIGGDLVGQKILAYGNLSLYEPWGKYQLRVARIEAAGEGFLQKQLEELIKKLKAEGLFDKRHKKELPKYPKTICLVTSVGSDAYNDFVKHTVDQFPLIELSVADVRVQGPKSISDLLRVLPQIDAKKFDIVVITRGGGSIEDLAAFNDEQVARTIFKMSTPTVVAVGHEANESLSEWVASVRASTPTDAAHIVVLGYRSILQTLDSISYKLSSRANNYFSTNLQNLDHIYFKLSRTKSTFKDLPNKLLVILGSLARYEKDFISDNAGKLENLEKELKKRIETNLYYKGEKIKILNRSLDLLSPDNVLARGYSVTFDKNGQIISSVKNIVVGESIGVKLADGKLTAQVREKLQK